MTSFQKWPVSGIASAFSSTSCPRSRKTATADSTSRSTSVCSRVTPRVRLKAMRSGGSGSASRSPYVRGSAGSVLRSRSSGPAITSISSAASPTVRVSGP